MKNEDEFEKWMDNEVRELEIYIQAQEKSPEHMWAKGAKSNTIASLSLTQQRMVEWLEKYRQLKTKPTAQRQDSTQDQLRDVVEQANNMGCYDAADVISTLIGKTEVSIDTNKPTAPKNLVEELRAYTRKRTEEGGSPRYFREHEIYEIINRYQPVETTGGLVEELTEMCKKIRGFGFDRVDLICVEEAISRHAKEQGKVVDKAGRCKQCCGEMVYIRGRIPGEPNRIVCPTCLQEKADDRNSQTMSGSSEQFEKSAKAIIAEMTEKISLPLPVLADIKGATIRQVKADTGQWFMSIRMGKGKNKQINAFYYEYLENLAREYLNTLEDNNKGE